MNLCDFDWVYERFKDDFALGIELAHVKSKTSNPNKKYKDLLNLATTHGIRTRADNYPTLEKAADGGNLKAVAELAHWLKGAGGTVGFDVFTEPAAQLEMHAKNGEAPQIKPLIAHLRQLAKRIVVAEDGMAAESFSETKPTKEMRLSEAPSPHESSASLPKPVVSRLANMKRLQPTILSFVEKLDDKIEQMEVALEKQDMTELADIAHWLKGAGGTVGYDDFTKPAAVLESCARADQVQRATQSLKEVKLLVTAIVPPVIDAKGNPGKEAI